LGGESSIIDVTAVRRHQGRLLIRVAGVENPEQAKAYAGALLYAARERIALEPGEYLDADLVGCRVCGLDGFDYGCVDAVEHFPASDMLIVGGVMVPMVAAHVRAIDLGERRIVIDPPAGLFE
jgi:16S rRNA processing protein RimM